MIRRVLFELLLFTLVFIGAALSFNYIQNKDHATRAVEGYNPTMGTAYWYLDGEKINRMQGYTVVLDTSLYRDSIVPLSSEKNVDILLPASIDTGADITYELRSFDGSNLIEEGDFRFSENLDELTHYTASLRMDMTEGVEYSFVIKASKSTGTIRFYTRVVRLPSDRCKDFIGYARSFSDSAYQGNAAANETASTTDAVLTYNVSGAGVDSMIDEATTEENTYIATSTDAMQGVHVADITSVFSSADASSAMYSSAFANKVSASGNPGYVTLGSSYEDVTYSGMKIDRLSEPEARVKEITEDSAIVELKYKAIAETEDGAATYAVSEYFTMEYNNGQAKIDVLDYRRYVSRDFNASGFDTLNNSINLGITADTSPQYITDDSNKRVAFVSGSSVWCVNMASRTYTSVYGTSLDEAEKERIPQEGYAIRLLSIDDEVMDFVVYGRINEGVREGQTGIALFEYTLEDSSLRELQFIPVNSSLDVLRLSVGRFCYYDRTNRCFYTLLGDQLLKIDIFSGEIEEVVKDIPASLVLVSKNMKCVAFPNNRDLTKVTSIRIINFETGKEIEKKEAGKSLALLGFVGKDIMYGVSAPDRVDREADGTPVFKFEKLCIVHSNGIGVKTYKKDNSLISGIEFEDNTIYLDRVYVSEETGEETDAKPDYISYKPELSTGDVRVVSIRNEADNIETLIKFPDNVYVSQSNEELLTKVISSGIKNETKLQTASLDVKASYIYEPAGITGVSYSVGKAVQQVYDQGGFVVDAGGDTLYKEKTSKPYLTVAGTFDYRQVESEADTFAACNYMCILAAGLYADYDEVKAANDWEDSFRLYSNEVRGVNISGVKLDTAVGYLSDGSPFAAKMNDHYVLVVSYNSDFIRYYDPIEGEEQRVQRYAFQLRCEAAGNEFYSFVK